MKGYKMIPTLIWFFLVVSLFLYVGLAFFLNPSSETAAALEIGMMDQLMGVMALFSLGLSFMIPRAVWKKAGAASVAPDTGSDEKFLDYYRRFYVGWIVRLALLEAVVLYGFVLAFISRSPQKILPFFLVSFVGFLLNYPSESVVLRSLEK